MLKVSGEVIGRVRAETGVLGDVSVEWFPVSMPWTRAGLTEVDSFGVPVGGCREGDTDGVFVDSGECQPGGRNDGVVWGVVSVDGISGELGIEDKFEEHCTASLMTGLSIGAGDSGDGCKVSPGCPLAVGEVPKILVGGFEATTSSSIYLSFWVREDFQQALYIPLM